jgi:hypothetical protein
LLGFAVEMRGFCAARGQHKVEKIGGPPRLAGSGGGKRHFPSKEFAAARNTEFTVATRGRATAFGSLSGLPKCSSSDHFYSEKSE